MTPLNHTPSKRLVNAIESYLESEKETAKISDKLLGFDDLESKQAKHLKVLMTQSEKTLDYAFDMIVDAAGSKDLAMQYLNTFSEGRKQFFDLYKSKKQIEEAAPDLLEALRPFAKYACDEPHKDEPDCYNCIARAAITKATGGQS